MSDFSKTVGTFNSFIVSFGDDDFFLDRDMVRAQQGKRSVVKLDAEEDLSDVALVELCKTYSDTPRIIIVDNAQKLKGTKVLQEFIEERNTEDRSLVIVAIVRSTKLPEIWGLAGTKGKVVERQKLKPWDNDGYVFFIKNEATKLGVAITKEVAEMLLQFVGTDLYRLENELRKLAIFVGRLGVIKKEHISLITTPTPKAEPFQIAEQVMDKNLGKALNLFSVLCKNSGDDAIIPVVYALMKQVEKTLIIRSCQDKGVSEGDIADFVGMKNWPYKNIAAPIARKHDVKSLVGYMGRLCKLDADVKSSARSKRTLVELTMLSFMQ